MRTRSQTPRSLFDALPLDALRHLAALLPLPDVYALRQALCGAVGRAAAAALHAEMRERVRDLHHLTTLMDHVHVFSTLQAHMPAGWAIAAPGGAGRGPRRPRAPRALGRFLRRARSAGARATRRGQFPLSPVEFVRRVDPLAVREITSRGLRTVRRDFGFTKVVGFYA